MMADLSTSTLLLLGLFGLAGGVGIAALGPGGILPTVGLFTLTAMSPAEVAGTAIVTHVATGVLGAAAFARSGELREPETKRTALILGGVAVVGTPVGVLINSVVSQQMFGSVLGVLVGVTAVLLFARDRYARTPTRAHQSTMGIASVGFAVATASGVIGIGGPMLAVPLLVVLGVPMLTALACAQAQSIVIASVGTLGYLASGTIDWPIAALVGFPELAGVLLGWKIARAVPAHRLKHALIIALLVLAPYLALHP